MIESFVEFTENRRDGDFRIITIDAGYELPEKGTAVKTLRSILESRDRSWEPGVFGSHSDANQIWAAGIKPILLGPAGRGPRSRGVRIFPAGVPDG